MHVFHFITRRSVQAGLCGIALCAASPGAARVRVKPPDARRSAIILAGGEILRRQAPDGAIVLGHVSDRPARVQPYFANFAARGLAFAYGRTHLPRYRLGARKWALWYEAHMNADGTVFDYTGAPGAWKATGDFDSTDSNAATYLILLRDLHNAAPDADWLAARRKSISRAVGAIRLTLQPNGLTIAKPRWPVMYTMDNAETARGLRAAAALARALRDPASARDWAALATRMEAAVETDLWDTTARRYRVGVQTGGGRMDASEMLTRWYPDQMANLIAIGFLPASTHHRNLYDALLAGAGGQIPAVARSEDDLDRLVWWGYAAQGAGDLRTNRRVLQALMRITADRGAVLNTALFGHICRLLAWDPPAHR